MPSTWNPNAVRRCVRLEDTAADVVMFRTKSFTKSDAADAYHPTVDLATGAAMCDCPHYTYRLARYNPTAADTEHLCKHLARAVENLKRRGFDL